MIKRKIKECEESIRLNELKIKNYQLELKNLKQTFGENNDNTNNLKKIYIF